MWCSAHRLVGEFQRQLAITNCFDRTPCQKPCKPIGRFDVTLFRCQQIPLRSLRIVALGVIPPTKQITQRPLRRCMSFEGCKLIMLECKLIILTDA